MTNDKKNLVAKILFLILLLASVACFLLARFITQTSFILISILALVAAVFTEDIKFGLSVCTGILLIALEFLHILPLPYNYLFSHGFSIGPAILITVLAAAAYPVAVIFIIFASTRFRK
jgi:hypothetical protein